MRVREWMSPDPVTVTPSTTVREARRLLRHYGIRHLPVLGRDGSLAGIVSDRDLRLDDDTIEALAHGVPAAELGLDREVEAVMSSPVHTIGADEPIDAAARLMLSRRVSALPVLDDAGALAGLLTTTDCLLASLEPAAAR
ncbi:MAG TPA: CBS domain-containing protein [Egibacteraceae bacterium]|nr:CBS domain-containing protein [Egibacteraceae bacterium]